MLPEDMYNSKLAVPFSHGGWTLRIIKLDSDSESYCIADGSCDSVFIVTVEGNSCRVNNVAATKKEWWQLFKNILNGTLQDFKSENNGLSYHFVDLDNSIHYQITNPGHLPKVKIEVDSDFVLINDVLANRSQWIRFFDSLLYEEKYT